VNIFGESPSQGQPELFYFIAKHPETRALPSAAKMSQSHHCLKAHSVQGLVVRLRKTTIPRHWSTIWRATRAHTSRLRCRVPWRGWWGWGRMHRTVHGCRRPEIFSHAAFQSGSSSAEVTLLPSRKVTMDQPGRCWTPLTMHIICRYLPRREKSQLTKILGFAH
jgi:hypothetical protein